MNSDCEPLPSVIADEWQELTAALRWQLMKRLPDTGAMTPAELREFAAAIRQALWAEQDAAHYDRTVELELGRATPPRE